MYKETLQSLMETEGLSADTILYRHTNPHHLKTDEKGEYYIEANPDSQEVVVDHYAQGHSMPASEFGPGLAFALAKDSRFKSDSRRCVSVRLGDVLDQGGVIYQDQSSGEPNSWFLTLPKGKVKVTIE